MKKFASMILLLTLIIFSMANTDCDGRPLNTIAKDEQAKTELNQRNLFEKQPPPSISWSLERDNLIKRFKLMNDRTVMFYMYLFIEGQSKPIGYYQVNKVSSVDSQLTNTEQIVWGEGASHTIPSPAEDGSYGTNGQGVFGFSPEDVYIEHNLKYIVSTIPLNFPEATRLVILNASTEAQLKAIMDKIK